MQGVDVLLFLEVFGKHFAVLGEILFHGLVQAYEETLDLLFVEVFQGRELVSVDPSAHDSFDAAHEASFLACQQEDGVTGSPRAPGASNSVYVGFHVERGVIIHDQADALDVESAGCHVGRD